MENKKYTPQKNDSDMAKEPAAAPTVFTPTQMVLLRMFSRDGTEEKAVEIQQVLSKYFRDKADKALDTLWESGELNQQRLDDLRGFHIRDILRD